MPAIFISTVSKRVPILGTFWLCGSLLGPNYYRISIFSVLGRFTSIVLSLRCRHTQYSQTQTRVLQDRQFHRHCTHNHKGSVSAWLTGAVWRYRPLLKVQKHTERCCCCSLCRPPLILLGPENPWPELECMCH